MQGICDHHFFSELHVGLQVQAFGNFITFMKSEEVVDSKYNAVASVLMVHMSTGTFLTECDRVNKFQDIVSKLGERFQFQIRAGHGYKTDGTVVLQSLPITNWEFKNEIYHSTTCPVSQNNAYFIHLQKGLKGRSQMRLVNVVSCHYLQVFGAVWNGEKCASFDPLCSPVSLLFVPHDPNYGVLKLARLLSVLDKTMGELKNYFDSEGETDTFKHWICY